MNYIQEDAPDTYFYTSMNVAARWLEIDLADYDWHIADIDIIGWDLEDPCWLPGEILSAKLKEYDYQFVWAVLSAFPKGTTPFTSEKVYADGNPDFWTGTIQKQLENSLFEIVCWDSSLTLFIGLPEEMGKTLLTNAPGIKTLYKYNKKYHC